MQVKEAMSQKPDYLNADDTIREAARHMRDHHTGFMPVARDGKLVGTVTDRDLAMRVLAEGKNLDENLSSIVSGKVLYCFEDTDVKEALRNMHDQHVQRLVVLKDEQHKDLAGIISISDIADKCADQDTELSGLICQATRHYH